MSPGGRDLLCLPGGRDLLCLPVGRACQSLLSWRRSRALPSGIFQDNTTLSRPGDRVSVFRSGESVNLSQPGDNATLSRLGHNTSPPHRKQSRPTSQTSLSRPGDNVSLPWSRLSIGSLPDGREFFCTYVMISLILVTFLHTQFSSHLVSHNVFDIALSTNVWKRLFGTPVIFSSKVVPLVLAD